MTDQRQTLPERDPNIRKHDFSEVTTGFDEKTVVLEASRCLGCKNAPCTKGCPVSVRIPEMMAAVKNGDFALAASIVKSTNFLPSVCGRVCPQETQCESKCVRGIKHNQIAIGAVERFVGDYALENEKQERIKTKTGKKAAVVGSGPSGLTCAAELLKAGIDVDIYESLHKAGGVLEYGIPEFRLPKALVKKEIDCVTALGAKLILNSVVGKTVTIDELKRQYDAVYIGSGAGLPMFMNVPGENLNGVMSANEYLTRINLMGAYKSDCVTPVQRGRNVIVVGAGNVAMDAARSAVRMGAESVTVVYRRGREEMPARKEEVRHAEEEGVEFAFLTNPVEFIGDEQGNLTKVVCVKMRLGEPDASGRRRPEPIENSEYEIVADMAIIALGTSPNPLIARSCEGLKTGRRGTLETDENLMTSIENVYAGGDAVTGAATVILAMGAGKKAASAIISKLIGEDKCL
ncbi:MAG: NADPH-dependent glutamate synthase [Candidatus Neoclostridium sp.]